MSFVQSRTRTAPEGIGRPIRRTEDERLVTGRGCYTGDVSLPGQAHACLVRSPHAHAVIARIDTADALKTPGVLAILTGADAVADGLGANPHRPVPTNPHEVPLKSRDGSPFFVSPHAPLPTDRARFVGEPVALVVAETPGAARDGAERVVIDWQPRPRPPRPALPPCGTPARRTSASTPRPGTRPPPTPPSREPPTSSSCRRG